MRREAGFSAVELLITLFIAAVFLVAGHQLYTAVMQNSGEVQQQARASNLAYQRLRQAGGTVSNPCSPPNPATTTQDVPASDAEGLANVKLTLDYSCPTSAVPQLTKITAKVTYGDGKEVSHAIYANGGK